jgi:hypothetical protein
MIALRLKRFYSLSMSGAFEFQIFDFYPENISGIHEQVRSGNVPFDSLFRIAAIGCEEIDPQDEQRYLQWSMVKDIIASDGEKTMLREDTGNILYGEMSDIVVDSFMRHNRQGYSELETMYYTLGDMAQAVKHSREERGVAVYNPMLDSPHFSEQERIWKTCVGDARKLWRTLVRRLGPDIINHPERYCDPCTYNGDSVHRLGQKSMVRRNISNSAISDTAVLRVYEESVDTGVKGIARVGQDILRILLAEEHPELYENM